VDRFYHESLALLVLEESLKVVVNEVALIEVSHEGLKVFVVVVNGFKEVEESFDDLHVGLTEPFI